MGRVPRSKQACLQKAATEFMRVCAVKAGDALCGVGDGDPADIISDVDRMYHLPDLPGDCSYGEMLDLIGHAHIYEFPKVDHTTDIVVFAIDIEARTLKVLLIRRGRPDEPYFDHWALPGGFINEKEPLKETAMRELLEETGVALSYMEQLATFSEPGRDPRGPVISTAYMGLVRPQDVTVKAADDAKEARWFDVDDLPSMAFDHGDILAVGLKRLRSKLRWQPIGLGLLGPDFTLTELQTVYEIILGYSLPKSSFRRRVENLGVLINTGKTRGKGHRPAKVFRFDTEVYLRLGEQGITFEV